MVVNTLLIAGSAFVLILALGQLLVRRQLSSNKILFSLFLVSALWITHAVCFRMGMLDRLPHLNKIYLPLLCVTGPLWYCYVRSLHDSTTNVLFHHNHLVAPLACLVLSIPFLAQDAVYKRDYIEVNVSDIPTATMYVATRLAELTLIVYFVKTLRYLGDVLSHIDPLPKLTTTRILWWLTLCALGASILRLVGSVSGDHTVSVLIPSMIALVVFVVMHFLSYRSPVVLGLDRAARQIRTVPKASDELETINRRIEMEQWFLDPDLKIRSLARKLGMPEGELSALINTAEGMNFNEYINRFRIEHAKQLLQSNHYQSILDIAFSSGFNSKSVFYQHFSRIAGMTPAQYRKRSRIELSVIDGESKETDLI